MHESSERADVGVPLQAEADAAALPVFVAAPRVSVSVPSAPMPAPPPLPSPHLDVLTPWQRRDAWFEMAVALSVGVLPNLMSAVASQAGWKGSREESQWWVITIGYVVHNLSVGLPTLWLIHRSGLAWTYFGFSRLRPWRDLLWGVVAFLATYGLMFVVNWGLWLASWMTPLLWDALNLIKPPADSSKFVADAANAPWWLFVASVTVTTTVEELFTRAYLVPALARLWKSPVLAVLAAAALMACYHIYQGSYSVVIIFLVEVVLNAAFWKYRRIWPFMLAHAAYDIALFVPYMMGDR